MITTRAFKFSDDLHIVLEHDKEEKVLIESVVFKGEVLAFRKSEKASPRKFRAKRRLWEALGLDKILS